MSTHLTLNVMDRILLQWSSSVQGHACRLVGRLFYVVCWRHLLSQKGWNLWSLVFWRNLVGLKWSNCTFPGHLEECLIPCPISRWKWIDLTLNYHRTMLPRVNGYTLIVKLVVLRPREKSLKVNPLWIKDRHIRKISSLWRAIGVVNG